MSRPEPHAIRASDCGASIALFLAGALLYVPTLGFGFQESWDDNLLVTQNAVVNGGLHWDKLSGMFGTHDVANWIPFSVLSHALDVSLYGLHAGGHHATNVLLHALNAALLFLLVTRLTGARLPGFLCACAFAFHPLQVESVAWIAERKNVLSTCCMLLSMLAYVTYVRAPSIGRYLAMTAWFVLGLLSKPMLVTLPVLLMLLDVWPLERWSMSMPQRARVAARLLLEKLPLLGLSIASGLMTLELQDSVGAMAHASLSLHDRLANSLLSSVRYLFVMCRPQDLSILYAHPYDPTTGGVPPTTQELLATFVTMLCLVALCMISRRAYLRFGMAFYLVSLAPVIGLVQVSMHGFADRFSYVPLIGIYLAVAFGACELGAWLLATLPRASAVLRVGYAVIVVGALSSLALTTYAQEQHWRNSLTLFVHAVEQNPKHAYLRGLLSRELDFAGEPRLALEQLEVAVKLDPSWADAHAELARHATTLGDTTLAIEQYAAALAIEPNREAWILELAGLLAKSGQNDLARDVLKQGLQQVPGSRELRAAANALR